MTKSELIESIHMHHQGLTKAQIGRLLDDLGMIVTQEVATGGSVVIPGLAKIDTKHRAARTGRNPQTGEPIEIPPRTVPSFRPLAAFRHAVQ